MSELYIEPSWAKKDTRFKKGGTPWNKGKKGWAVKDPEKKRVIEENLAHGRAHCWDTRKRVSYNAIPTSVYTLGGEYVASFVSSEKAAERLGVAASNIRKCMKGERKRCGRYMFRKAEVVTFNGVKAVKKSNIEPLIKQPV